MHLCAAGFCDTLSLLVSNNADERVWWEGKNDETRLFLLEQMGFFSLVWSENADEEIGHAPTEKYDGAKWSFYNASLFLIKYWLT
jgi:hypothetical protein